jgi:hypothetical protein
VPGTTHTAEKANHQWLLVLAATLFNILFEYSARGASNIFTAPLLFPLLFILYFSLFTLLEDLIVRFRLRDYHFLILVFFYGTVYEFFASGAALHNPEFLGINWVTLVFINVAMWASVQGILTFYLATRAFPRGPHPSLLGERGWTIALAVNLISLALIHIGGNIPAPKLVPLLVLFVILIVATIVFNGQVKKMEWRSKYVPFRKSTVLDLTCLFTIAIFLFNAFVIIHDQVKFSVYNATALRIDLVWVCAVALILLIYRVIKGEPIPV